MVLFSHLIICKGKVFISKNLSTTVYLDPQDQSNNFSIYFVNLILLLIFKWVGDFNRSLT